MPHVGIISIRFVWYIYGLRGALALLVSTFGLARASRSGASGSAGLHAFFMS